MFRPLDLFLKKHQDENENEATEKWHSLSNKKKLKFIKKAETKYDESIEDEKAPFHTYLTGQELDLLMKSYDLPERPPPNSKRYLINKYKSSQENGDEAQVKKEADQKWANMKADEKNGVLDEYHKFSLKIHKLLDDYELNYIDFIRTLPEQRVQDYKHYLATRKLRSKHEPNSQKTKNTAPKPKGSPKKKKKENIKYRASFRIFVPHEIFLEKMKKEEHQNGNDAEASSNNEFRKRIEARSAYKNLSDKKKLKYIRQAETNFDSYNFDEEDVKPRFSFFLTKEETELLLKSYGLPESVPNNVAAFYMKKRTKNKPGIMMDDIFKTYREMIPEEKEQLVDEYKRERKEYEEKLQEFLAVLPPGRVNDYNAYAFPKRTLANEANNHDSPSSSASPDKAKKRKISQ